MTYLEDVDWFIGHLKRYIFIGSLIKTFENNITKLNTNLVTVLQNNK